MQGRSPGPLLRAAAWGLGVGLLVALAVLLASLLQLGASAGLVAGWLKLSGQWWVLQERD